jgi:predicted nucleotidyltransferase
MKAIDTDLAGWRERARRLEAACKDREDRARALLPLLVSHLVGRYGARRVVLIGSLAEGGFGLESDIDLAVQGIAGAAIYRAGAATAVRVAAKIREERANVEKVVDLLREALLSTPLDPPPAVVVVHGVGGLVHDFYTGVENLFRDVSPDLNGYLPSGDAWHRELLHSMTLPLLQIRPALIDALIEGELLAYLKFRQLYRNLYGFRLEWRRVRELAGAVEALWIRLRKQIDAFLAYLDSVGSSVLRGG